MSSHLSIPRLLTIAKAAESLGVCTETVKRWAEAGTLEIIGIGPRGDQLRVTAASIDEHLKAARRRSIKPRRKGRVKGRGGEIAKSRMAKGQMANPDSVTVSLRHSVTSEGEVA